MASYYIGLSLLSNKWEKQAERKKLLHEEGRRILSLLENHPIGAADISKGENGRPFFTDRRADFNISHSGNLAAVSMVKSKADNNEVINDVFTNNEVVNRKTAMMRTGCDLELVRPRTNIHEMTKKFFSPAEREYIQSDMAKFFQIWTLKECFLKLKGLSVFDMAQVPSFIRVSAGGSGQFAFCGSSSTPLSFSLYELAGEAERYILATVIEGTGQIQPEIRWFSPSFLPCNNIVEINAETSPPETVRAKM